MNWAISHPWVGFFVNPYGTVSEFAQPSYLLWNANGGSHQLNVLPAQNAASASLFGREGALEQSLASHDSNTQ